MGNHYLDSSWIRVIDMRLHTAYIFFSLVVGLFFLFPLGQPAQVMAVPQGSFRESRMSPPVRVAALCVEGDVTPRPLCYWPGVKGKVHLRGTEDTLLARSRPHPGLQDPLTLCWRMTYQLLLLIFLKVCEGAVRHIYVTGV